MEGVEEKVEGVEEEVEGKSAALGESSFSVNKPQSASKPSKEQGALELSSEAFNVRRCIHVYVIIKTIRS